MDKKEEKGASRERIKNREKEGAKKIRKKTESGAQDKDLQFKTPQSRE